MLDRLIGAPDPEIAVDGRGVEAPREAGRVELVAQRRRIPADDLVAVDLTLLVHHADEVAGTAGTTPRSPRVVHRGLGLSRDDVLMRDEAARVEVRRVHLIGQHVLLAHVEVWLRLGVRDVAVLRVRIRARVASTTAAHPFLIESVHLAIGTGETPRAVAGLEERGRAVIEIPCGLEPDRLERDLLIGRVVAILRGFCAGKTVEQVIEGAVLLNDDDDVLDLAARGGTVDPLDRGDLRRMRRPRVGRCRRVWRRNRRRRAGESAVAVASCEEGPKDCHRRQPAPELDTTHYALSLCVDCYWVSGHRVSSGWCMK